MSEVQSKRPWLSKSVWVGVLVAVAPLIPGVNKIIAANPEYVLHAVGAIAVVLRLITKDKIQIS